jgi:DNA polymerase elongation subunit (family B)
MQNSFYTSAVQWGNVILVRGVHDGKRFKSREKFAPTLYVPSKDKNSSVKGMNGEPLQPVQFEDIKEAKEFVEQYKKMGSVPVYGNASFQYQYISETYRTTIEPQFEHIAIFSLDIECASENGFPDPTHASEEVLLITIQDKESRKTITFGSRNFDVNQIKNFDPTGYEYVRCKDETDLLATFLGYWEAQCPDVVTGWNIQSFDIPYLVNRMIRVLSAKEAARLSPWKNVNERFITVNGREIQIYDIQGFATLDYLDLYRKFVQERQESYKLEYIARLELGHTKVENPYATYKEFYTKDWHSFVEYNVVDTHLINQLEDQKGFIELIITMAYDARCNYTDAFSPVRMWDCIIYNDMLSRGISPPQPQEQIGRGIEGAFVQHPEPGRYYYIAGFDATSMYPRNIMEFNMSPETFAGIMPNVNVDKLLTGNFDGEILVKNNVSLAANGAMFSREKRGILPSVVRKVFDERIYYKRKQLDAETEFERTKNPKLKIDISRYKNIQKAKKTQLVSLYGAMANRYFRFYDDRIAEAITLTGQFYIRSVSAAINDYLCKTLVGLGGQKHDKWVFYNDTDSSYVSLKPLIDHMFPEKNKPQSAYIDVMDQICKKKISPVISDTCRNNSKNLNTFESEFEFKREILADVGLWSVKKRYALRVWDKEGIRYEIPIIKITGLESQRSSTPEVVRNKIKDAIPICLAGSEEELHSFIRRSREEMQKLPPEAIAFPRGVNGLSKYGSAKTIYGKGTPMQVRAALLYNHWIRKYGLTAQYEEIREGDKIRFIYLKEPNPIGENCIGFIGSIPKELDVHRFIDFDTQFEKTFLSPLTNLIGGMGWSVTPQASLASLFGD